MAAKSECVFCNLDSRFVIDENRRAFAAHFNCAIKTGHIVVALKDHVTSLSRITPSQAGDLMTLTAQVASKAEGLVGCLKFYLVSITDETPHYHIHLLPRMADDPPLGPHIMGEKGWSGEAGNRVDEKNILDFISAYKRNSE
jgi:diadenosine tetraphosphate (Ap4A) HIT family hydrolase